MEENLKHLLLKDLCARLPYQVKCQMEDDFIINDSPFYDYILSERHIELFRNHKGFYIKPYLRPMSSMTEEQKKEFDQLIELELKAINDEIDQTQATEFEVDFYNKHHLDWRGLIPKGLAIDAIGLNIY